MKKEIHPDLRKVVFQDSSCDFSFLSLSTVPTKETIQWEDGQEYPLFKLDISSGSHPFYTGKKMLVDTEGRIDRFKKKWGEKRQAVLDKKKQKGPRAVTVDK